MFFQVPNQTITSRILLSRACFTSVSRKLKSKLPSFGSICSHAIGISSVLAPASFSAVQTFGKAAG